ncbi:lactosylceramide 4-alpha-galactosyltransferase-like [Haemaphysalis longicornis]
MSVFRRAQKEVVKTGRDQIWFLETSYRNNLTARAACSIESACRHNRNHTVHLLSTGNIRHCPYHDILSSLGNFKSESLNVTALLKDTPLLSVYSGGALNKSAFAVEHLSDLLRYAVLWHKGGIYLDTDVIVLKSLSGITNSAVYERENGPVANGVLVFDARHPALWALITVKKNHQFTWKRQWNI